MHSEVTALLSSYCSRRRGPIGRLDGLCASLFALLAACLIAVLAGCGYAPNGSAGPLSVSPSAILFGAVPIGQTATIKVSLLNQGSAPVEVSQLHVAGQSFSANGQSTLPVTISGGGTYTFDIAFRPGNNSSYSGQFTATNGASSVIAQGSITGVGISTSSSSPALTLSTDNLTFGNVTVNTASTQPVTLTSTGTAPVTIRSAAVTGTGFTIAGGAFPVTLSPGQSITLKAGFDPTVIGAAVGQLTIQNSSSADSTTLVTLSGTGTAAASSPQLMASTASLTFGNVTVSTASTKSVTLTSTGMTPVTISSAAFVGSGFTLPGTTFPITVDPGQMVQLTVQFDPTAVGPAAGQLKINSNSSTNRTLVISLSGTGLASGSFAYAGSPLIDTLAPARPPAPISNNLFGMTIYNLAPNSVHFQPGMTPFPPFPVSIFRFWDVVYWSMIDNYEGESNFTKMDNSIAIAQKNGVRDFIFTFGHVPGWASTKPSDPCVGGSGPGTCAPPNMDAFDKFARRLVQRYCGTVKYYEPWNEPNSKEFWDGTNAQLLTIAQHTYQIAKDPANCGCTNGICTPSGGANPNQVLLPPISMLTPAYIAWLDSYLATAGTSYPYADVAAFHGYVWSGYVPEEITSGVQLLKQTLGKYGLSNLPLWNTEVSWELDTNDNDQNQVSWLMRYHATQVALGISRVVWYAYENCTWGTLWSSPLCGGTEGPTDPVGRLTVAGAGYGTIEKWFTGATLTQCQQYQNGLWACELQRSGGNYDAWMLWSNSGKNIPVPIAERFGLTVYRDYRNEVMPLPAQITVTQMPVLLENYDF